MTSMPGPVDAASRPRRLMLVHAHPDDETTTTGATMARYAAEGVDVCLVTCTRGESGEIVDPALAGRIGTASGHEPADLLGAAREDELRAACAALGVRDQRFLGGTGRWWDSGADGLAPHPSAFARGDRRAQEYDLVGLIREVRPQVVVTYDAWGGYGHPDHVRAHEVTMAATASAAVPDYRPELGPAWRADRVYASVVPSSVLRGVAEQLAAVLPPGANPFAGGKLPFEVPDEAVSVRVDARRWLPDKLAAMRAHRSQMGENGWFFAIAEVAGDAFGVEYFQLLAGTEVPGEPADDLFSGLWGG